MPQLPPQAHLLLLVPGVALLGLGLLVLWNPELIKWMVAGTFLVLGALLLLLGLRMKRMFG